LDETEKGRLPSFDLRRKLGQRKDEELVCDSPECFAIFRVSPEKSFSDERAESRDQVLRDKLSFP